MRLTSEQARIIKSQAQEVFGDMAGVCLFGSRTDDAQKGGDIDLYIEPESDGDLFHKRNQLVSRLQMALGEQTIDIVIARDPDRLIEQEARITGIRL